MTYQQKKNYLEGYLKIRAEYERQLWRYQELRSTFDGLKAQIIDDMPKGQHSRNDKTATKMGIIEQLELANNVLLERYKHIEGIIATIEDSFKRELLRYHYIEGLSIQQLADKYNYSYEYICRMRQHAIEKLEFDFI